MSSTVRERYRHAVIRHCDTWRHKMLTGNVDNTNGIDVEISFGAATGTDHVVMTTEKGKQEGDLSHKR